jgi:diguanylate cyclase
MNTDPTAFDIKEIHWLMDILHSVDVGLVVLDLDYKIELWNGFMENYSGIDGRHAKEKSLFELFPEIPKAWFTHKLDSVVLLKNRAFTIWEQRPFLFQFKNNRPVTGTEEYMFQDINIMPLMSADGQIKHICVMVYDVTGIATNKKDLSAANEMLKNLSRTDKLTQLNNRGYWEEQLQKEFDRHKRTNESASVIMFDIDHFKKVNDTYGHQAGDECIRRTSQALRDTMRNTDIGGRYGGEEFGVILVGTNAENANIFAERLRETIAKIRVVHDNNEIQFTISLGISELVSDIPDAQEWLEESDKALYQSKEGGRNQVSTFKRSAKE